MKRSIQKCNINLCEDLTLYMTRNGWNYIPFFINWNTCDSVRTLSEIR